MKSATVSMRSLILAIAGLALLSSCSLFERRTDAPRKVVVEQNRLNEKRSESGPRKRILVLPFLDEDPNRSPAFRERARQAFLMDLNRTGDVLAVDAMELKTNPSLSLKNGEYDFKNLSKESLDLGVMVMLEGRIQDLQVKRSADSVGIIRKMTTTFEAKVRVRLAHARGGREIFNTIKTVTVEQDNVRVAESVQSDRFIRENPEVMQVIVKDAFLDFTPQILAALDKISWEGRIAAINGDRIYLNVGRQSGLQVGDLLRVAEDGDEVFDPESGRHLGRVPGRMKGTLEVISYFGNDGAISVIHSGAGFRENDRVELYQ